MDTDLPSSDIRELLADDQLSDVSASDIEADNFPDDVSLEDFSSGSGEVYHPNLGDIDSSDEENSGNEGNNNSRPNTTQPTWLRAYPPEPPIDIEQEFRVRNPGVRNCPPRNSPAIQYFFLFFTTTVWEKIVKETNAYARKLIQNKRDSAELRQFSRLQFWSD
ncbi:hypothetical protein J6590_096202, partial [Homalodisca vitripennis]